MLRVRRSVPRRSETDDRLSARSQKRLRKMGTTQILDWADTASMGMQQGFEDYRAEGDLAALGEIALNLIALEEAVKILIARREAELGLDAG